MFTLVDEYCNNGVIEQISKVNELQPIEEENRSCVSLKTLFSEIDIEKANEERQEKKECMFETGVIGADSIGYQFIGKIP
jgi:hypothetical protein